MPESILAALVAPRNVALIGASANSQKLTARPLTFLRQHGYPGRIYPVNLAHASVSGMPSFTSVSAIPETVDHAYILLDAEAAISALEDCAAAGVRVVSVLADGFGEAGPEGLGRQARLVAIARQAGILLVGPNSMGVVSTSSGFACTTNAAFQTEKLLPGRLAVLSQSGSMIGAIMSRGLARGIGFSTLISVGNEAGAGVAELGQILLDDPGTDGFVLFMETVRNPAALRRFARCAVEQGKSVTAYMIGRSEEGQTLAVSHTGALTGSARAVSAFLKDIGIRVVEHFETLIEAPRSFALQRALGDRPRAVTVVSTTGGGGAMLVDQISARGVPIAGCSADSRRHLAARGIVPGYGKLVDVTLAGTKYETMKEVISTLAADPETGLLLVAIGSSAQFNPELAVSPIVDAVAEAEPGSAPVMAFPVPHAPESLKILEAGGIPAFGHLEICAETVALFLTPAVPASDVLTPLPEIIRTRLDAAPGGVLDEVESGEVFASLGLKLPSQVVLAPDDPLPEALPFGFPVVAKLVSADLPHKTEAGAVRVGIPDRKSLACAIEEMRASAELFHPGYRLSGIMVQEVCRGIGEMLIGLNSDPVVGPVITVGMGGVMAEVYADTAVRPAPVSIETAHSMMQELKGLVLLKGFRGKPAGDMEALARSIAAVSLLALSARVLEAEINPLLVGGVGEGTVALDALIRLD